MEAVITFCSERRPDQRQIRGRPDRWDLGANPHLRLTSTAQLSNRVMFPLTRPSSPSSFAIHAGLLPGSSGSVLCYGVVNNFPQYISDRGTGVYRVRLYCDLDRPLPPCSVLGPQSRPYSAGALNQPVSRNNSRLILTQTFFACLWSSPGLAFRIG